MTPREYARSAVFDLIICLVMSATFAMGFADGFNIYDSLRLDYPLVFGIAAALTALLVVAAYNLRTAVIGGIVYVVACLALLAYGATSSAGYALFQDEFGNRFLFFVILVVTCTLVFLLSRRTAGAVAVAVVGVFLIVVMQFLYLNIPLPLFAGFLIAAVVNCLYRGYARTLRVSDSPRPSFAGVVLVGLALTALAMGMGLAIWHFVIEPLNPPAQELILIREYKARPEIEMQGSSSPHEIEDQDQGQQDEDAAGQDTGQDESDGGTESGYDDSGQRSMMLIAYELLLQWWQVLVAVLIALALLLVLVRKLIRRRRFQRMRALPAGVQVQAFHRFFLRRFEKMGFPRAPGDSLQDFLVHADDQLRRFEDDGAQGEGASADPAGQTRFARLTATHEAVAYGGVVPDEAAVDGFADYYGAFYRRCRRYLGSRRYIIWFFRL